MGGKQRTKFSIVHKAEALDLLDELEAKGSCALSVSRKKKRKRRRVEGTEVLVFHTKKEIADHYKVKKSTISNLVALSGDQKEAIRQKAAQIKQNNLNAEQSRLQVRFV